MKKTEERSVVALIESFNAVVVVNNPGELLGVLGIGHPLHRQLALTHWKDGDREITLIPTRHGAAACVVELATFQAEKMVTEATRGLDSNHIKASKS